MNVNVYGPITCATSYGIVTRNVVTAMAQLGHQVAATNIQGNVLSYLPEETAVAEAVQRSVYWNNTAPCLKIFHANQLNTFVGTNGSRVGYPIFELDTFSETEIAQLLRLDALVVTSKWAFDICDKHYISDQVSTHIAPLGVNRNIFNDQLQPTDNDIAKDDACKFLCVGKWEVRKGHDIVLQAFDKAFSGTDNVALIMACRNHFLSDKRNDDWAIYYKTGKYPDKIYVLDKYLESQKNISNLMSSIDIGVCVSRAEGWDMPLMEFLSMGKNVIATNCTAHTEFCNKDNAMLVECPEMEPAADGVFFNGQGNWHRLADKEIEATAAYMRHCYELKRAGKLAKNLAGIETAKRFNWAFTAQQCVEACA